MKRILVTLTLACFALLGCHGGAATDAGPPTDAGTGVQVNPIAAAGQLPAAQRADAGHRRFRGVGGGLPDGGGIAPSHVLGDDIFYFGNGADGDYAFIRPDGGACFQKVLDRDYYFHNLGGQCTVVTAGWRAYVSNTFDTTQGLIVSSTAIAGSNLPNGGAGENCNPGNTQDDGGAGGFAPITISSLPFSLAGSAGGTGTTTTGTTPSAQPASEPSNGGTTLASGAGGPALSGVGGLSVAGITAVFYPINGWTPNLTLFYGSSPVLAFPLGGLSGAGGGGGAGNGAQAGGGAGGGGGGAPPLWIAANIVNRGTGTSPSAVRAIGGNGGLGGTGCSAVHPSAGAGGGAAGSGGDIEFYFAQLEGSPVAVFFDASGGTGGNGGISNGVGGNGGAGGGGAASGTINVTDLTNQIKTPYTSVVGTAGGAPLGGDAGVGGAGGVLQVSL
jgi:hypothetical protein